MHAAHTTEVRDTDPALARICRLAFDDMPAAAAMQLLSSDEGVRSTVSARAQDLPPDRSFARYLRARIDPGWPPPATARDFRQRLLMLRADIAARLPQQRGLDEDCEEFALLRAAAMLTGIAPPSWPEEPADLPTALSGCSLPLLPPRAEPISACLTDLADIDLPGRWPAVEEQECAQAEIHAWFGTACAIAACYHMPRTPNFGAALELLIGAGPPATTRAGEHEQVVMQVRAL